MPQRSPSSSPRLALACVRPASGSGCSGPSLAQAWHLRAPKAFMRRRRRRGADGRRPRCVTRPKRAQRCRPTAPCKHARLLTALSGRVWSHLRSRRRRRPRQTIPLAPRTAATAPTRCSSACAGWRRCPLAQHACARTGCRELVLSAEVIELNIFAPSNTAAALTGSMIARACCVSLPRGRGRKRSGREGGAGGGRGRSVEKD